MMKGTTMTKKQTLKRRNAALKRLKRWHKKPPKDIKNKCWFKSWVIERYGEKSGCSNKGVEYNDCGKQCHWVSTCPHCNKDLLKFIVQTIQTTSGAINGWLGVCVNPECEVNKAKEEVKEKEPSYYV